MRVLWLADVLRAAGLTVVEHSGWQARTAGGSWEPRYGIVHATAAPYTQGDETQVRIVRDGRQGLSGPIANACVDRRGRWHVLAAGRCNTTLVGTAGPYRGLGNQHALGVEACNDNRAEPWPPTQYRAYVRGWAAIARKLGWGPDRLRGHREHTPGHKTDPTFDMTRFRADVASVLAGEDDDMPSTEEIATGLLGTRLGRGTRTVGMQLQGAAQAGQVTEVLARLDALIRAQAGLSGDEILAEIRRQGEATRAALLTAVTERAPELAAAVADRLGDQVAVDELGAALARELAELLVS